MQIFFIIAIMLLAFSPDLWQGPLKVIRPVELQSARVEAIAFQMAQTHQAALRFANSLPANTLPPKGASCAAPTAARPGGFACVTRNITAAQLTQFMPINLSLISNVEISMIGRDVYTQISPGVLPQGVTPNMVLEHLTQLSGGSLGIGIGNNSNQIVSPVTNSTVAAPGIRPGNIGMVRTM